MEHTYFNNPILPGFYPDPSLCRAGDDYYLVTSTFSYFPGIPVFHSRDLIHWEQIGNVLTRSGQFIFDGNEQSQGIFAPTIRYHDGLFYVITTNVSVHNGMNFIVTAENPAGPWSDPYPLASEGIDPSLFFDDDGKCYYCGTKERREGSKYYGDNEIYIQELDLKTMKLIGESTAAWHGALRDAVWPEGPHLYKKDGYYYLLISEAGTEYYHAVTIARSKSLREPFKGNRANPILTHRHLGYHYPIVNVGHPDIVETKNGESWMVLLGSRPYGGYYRNLGRETFLVPFIWEDGWPVVNPGKGIVENKIPVPNLPESPVPAPKETTRFNIPELPFHFMYLRNPNPLNYSLTERPGFLRMKCSKEKLTERKSPSYVCVRQQSMSFLAETVLEFEPKNRSETAGLVINQSQDANLQCLVSMHNGSTTVQLVKIEKGEETVLASGTPERYCPFVRLVFEAAGQDLTVSYSASDTGKFDNEKSEKLAEHIDTRFLSTDCAGGFVGNTIGLYCSSNGSASDTVCDFEYLTVKKR